MKWAKDNLKLNKLDAPQHTMIQSDVQKYLLQAQKDDRRFTLAFVDPPSFYQDEKKSVSFDIDRDHPDLLKSVFKVMAPGAQVYFSTNHQRFEPDFQGLPFKDIKELTPKTIPEDYRNQQIHRCWKMAV